MDKILEVNNVSKKYKNFDLKDISFSLDKGYIMGFIGPNGAGKTTTIKLIMNLINRDSGFIKIFSKDNIKNEKDVKDKIGFVYDQSYYFEDMNLKDNTKIISPFYSKWNQKKFEYLIKKFGLEMKFKVKDLSKGMKMKFSLAVALSHEAELLIMDEPTSGLDPVFRSEILDILREYIQNENRSVLFSTHIITDLEKTADYITLINKGKLLFSDEKDLIIEKYSVIKGSLEILDNGLEKKFVGIKKHSYGFEGLTNSSNFMRKKFGDSIIIDKPSLEDIMLYMVGEKHETINI